jgi:hypothetical protein
LNNGLLITSKRKLNPADAANVQAKTIIGKGVIKSPKYANIDMTATSITEDGAQNLLRTRGNRCTDVSGTALGPNCTKSLLASSLAKPVDTLAVGLSKILAHATLTPLLYLSYDGLATREFPP